MPAPAIHPAAPRVDLLALAMGVTFALIWSSAFTSAKIALAYAPPFLMLSVRFAIAGVIACAIAAVLGQRAPRDRKTWAMIAVFGVCQNALYLGLNFLGMTTVPAGLAAIIASALPLTVAALGRAASGERLSPLGLAGLAAGFSGVLLVMGGRVAGGVDPVGVALCVAGLLALTVATRVVQAASAGGGGLLMVVGLQMLVGGAALAPVGLIFESVADVTPSWPLAAAFAYTTFVPGVIATLIWFSLVGRVGPTAAASFHFLNPAFGVGIAAALLGETLNATDLAGVVLASAGIVAVQVAKRARSREAAAAPTTRSGR